MIDFFVALLILIDHKGQEVGALAQPVATAEECLAFVEAAKVELLGDLNVELRAACIPARAVPQA